jgi:hypothetical protein
LHVAESLDQRAQRGGLDLRVGQHCCTSITNGVGVRQ